MRISDWSSDVCSSDLALQEAQVRARQRLALGQRLVVAADKVVALFDVGREEAKLAGRGAPLAIEAGLRQAGLLATVPGDRRAAGREIDCEIGREWHRAKVWSSVWIEGVDGVIKQ